MTGPGHPGAGIEYVAMPSTVLQEAAGRAGLGGETGLSGSLGGLSPRERDASHRFRRPEDRLDYHASHALFRLLAARRLGLRPADAAGLAVRRICGSCGAADHGKPAIEGVALSMSRSHGTVMAAAGPAGTSLGADIERVPGKMFAGFDEFVLAPEEREAPDGPGLPSPQLSNAGRIRWWVAKEAVLKAAGVGLAVPPSSVRLVPAGIGGTSGPAGPAGPFLAECAGNTAVHGLLVTPVPAPEGYAAAVAASECLPLRAVSLAEIFATKV
ncbi:4'-phosphopantetheinyl transferase family protein [Arthrobacter sp. EPSL27]|uniref:4'-phosphopantetheinyl transferase family protein n=1 Tax=Arthrobacter sp. EPSL27 TaxID=1745378 RepID=UPI000B2B59E4|nr:4'-phosphopantetheinyl transferase superfamily protein [Arthrobacter sp. EPSL27]